MISCVAEALKAGKITKTLAKQLDAAENIDDAIELATLNLARQKREAAIQAMKVADGWDNVSSHPISVYHGLRALLSRDMTEKAGYNNVDKLTKFYQHKYHSQFADAIEAFRTKKFGITQDEAGTRNLIKAIYGEVVDDPEIMNFAKQWRDMAEDMRLEFNSKGGSIAKNDSWLLPQKHDARTIKKVGLDEWKTYIKDGKLDLQKMTNDKGEMLSEEELDKALDYVYDSITTNGLNKVKDLAVPKLGKKLSRKGSEKRFLYFKDAEAWMDYNKEFGTGDIFPTLTDHIQAKAHDIAVLEIMGPSPESTYSTLFAMADKAGLKDNQKTWLKALWNTASGKVNGGDLAMAGDVGAVTSNVMVGSTLGGAVISATSDVGFQFLAAKHNNLPITKVYGEMIKQLNPANKEHRMFAARMGLGLDEFTDMAGTANRWGEVYGTGKSAKVADFVMRASFLTNWTAAGRSAFGKVFAAEIASEVNLPFSKLGKERLRAFKTYGITEDVWDSFRKKPLLEYRGVKHIDVTQKGSEKFHQMIISETDQAVPSPDYNTRAVTTGGKERNSVTGQLVRTLSSLKSFPVTVIQTHGYRMAYMEGAERLQYAGMLLGITTAMGGISLQLKDIAAGRTPRDTGMEDGDAEKMRKFFGAAMAQGGGLGILGDYLFSDQNRFGGGPVSSAFGPKGEMVTKAAQLTVGNVQQLLAGEDTNFVEETIQTAKRYTPDIWQTRLLTDSMFDQLTIMADPKFENKLNKQMRKRDKEYNQSHWIKKGEFLPEALQ